MRSKKGLQPFCFCFRCSSEWWQLQLKAWKSWSVSWWMANGYKMSGWGKGSRLSVNAEWSRKVSIWTNASRLFVSLGGDASSPGCLRRLDSPPPKAGATAKSGRGPPICQLQQRCHGPGCCPLWGGSASHRLQPCVPLSVGAQSKFGLFWPIKPFCGNKDSFYWIRNIYLL